MHNGELCSARNLASSSSPELEFLGMQQSVDKVGAERDGDGKPGGRFCLRAPHSRPQNAA